MAIIFHTESQFIYVKIGLIIMYIKLNKFK